MIFCKRILGYWIDLYITKVKIKHFKSIFNDVGVCSQIVMKKGEHLFTIARYYNTDDYEKCVTYSEKIKKDFPECEIFIERYDK